MRKLTVTVALIIACTPLQTQAGVLKWAGRGATACAISQSCRGVMGRGLLKGGEVAISKLGPHLLARCMTSPQCTSLLDKALSASAGTAAAAAAWKSLEMWMLKTADTKSAPGIDESARTGSIMPDPEDPFEKEKSEDVEFKPTKRGLQHAYDRHKADWGFTQNRNNQVLQQYEERLRNFMRAPDTLRKTGMYKGQNVVHYYNRSNNLWVSVNRETGEIAGAWKISPEQLHYLETIGKVSSLLSNERHA